MPTSNGTKLVWVACPGIIRASTPKAVKVEKTLTRALEALGEIARLKRSDAILCDVGN